MKNIRLGNSFTERKKESHIEILIIRVLKLQHGSFEAARLRQPNSILSFVTRMRD